MGFCNEDVKDGISDGDDGVRLGHHDAVANIEGIGRRIIDYIPMADGNTLGFSGGAG